MQTLLLSKSNLDKLVDGLQDLVYTTDPERKITYANNGFANIFRYENPHQLIGRAISELYVEPNHRILLEDSMRERGGRVINYFVYVKRSTGDRFCLSVDSNWIDENEDNGIEGTGRDLTDLVNFLGAFFQVDLNGVLTFCSPRFAKLFGYGEYDGPKFLIGTSIQKLLLETCPFIDFCKHILQSKSDSDTFNTITAKQQGSATPIRVRVSVGELTQPLKSERIVFGYQGIFEDVTAVERAQEELAEQHRIHELLMTQSQDGIYVIQGKKLVMFTPKFCSMLEREEKELLNMPYIELVHPNDRTRVQDEVNRKLNGEERNPYEFKILTGSGKERIVRAFSGYCTINKVDSVYGYLRDITEELRREEELNAKIAGATEIINKELEYEKELLDTVVHEIDAPTVAIRGIAERLVVGISTNSMDFQRQLRKLEDIDELCQLLFMLKKNVSLADSEFNMAKEVSYCLLERDLLKRAINFMKPLLRNKDLPFDHIQVHLTGVPPYVIVNYDLFQQVFFNLLSNTVKYVDPNTNDFRLEINSKYSYSKGLFLYFRDWGIGIPEGEENAIFEKRRKGSNATGNPGMGLGLWVTKRILEASGCEIWVEKLSQPTTFVVRIPKKLLAPRKLKGES